MELRIDVTIRCPHCGKDISHLNAKYSGMTKVPMYHLEKYNSLDDIEYEYECPCCEEEIIIDWEELNEVKKFL